MKLFIPKDYFDNPTPPEVYLCNTSKRIIGQLPVYNCSGTFKWNTYSEITFSVDRTYVDALTGETKVHPLFDKIESPRNIYVRNIGYFSLQDIDTSYTDKDSKTVTAFSLEYSTLGTKYLTNFKINKGDVDSKEVIYLSSQYGDGYVPSKDDQYIKAIGEFDPYEAYYIKDYTGNTNDSYVWAQEEIRDASVYATYDGSTVAKTLYVRKYPRVEFYHPTKPKLSLVHLILELAPEWQIGRVDAALWHKERSFDETRVAIYDFLTGTVAETFGCIVEFDTLTNTINFYEEVDDGITEDNEVATRWKTDVTISRENLASEINVSYSSDNIKTKLVVSGADDLSISEVNFDRNAIMNLSFYHTLDWMEQDLFEAYDNYLKTLEEAETGLDAYGLPSKNFPVSHSDAVQKWVAAQNKWNDAMHAVPAENDAVLVGDEFKKLYCMYTPINTAFTTETISEVNPNNLNDLYYNPECTRKVIKTSLDNNAVFVVQGYEYKYNEDEQCFEYVRNVATTTALTALVNKLNLYHVNEDIDGKTSDNILLKLKNANSDVATIRIYDPKKPVDQGDNAFDPSLTYYEKEITISGTAKYNKITITDQKAYDNKKASLYTNNYAIQSIIARAESGIDDAASYWSISDWIKGELTAEEMGFVNEEGKPIFTVSSIGTMGAYFVLAENEFEIIDNELVPSKDYLRRYGVNLLKEKHAVYTTIFQTQTEAMFSQEGYQCTASDNPPSGTIAKGTRWLDTDSSPMELKEYDGEEWVVISADVPEAEQEKYTNYQRYIDNYKKLQAVQEVLAEKEQLAEYGRDGYIVPNKHIDISLYKPNKDGDLSYNNHLLVEDMYKIAQTHFKEITAKTGKSYSIAKLSLDTAWPLYTFVTSFDPINYGPDSGTYKYYTQYYEKEDVALDNGTTVPIYKTVDVPDEAAYNTLSATKQLYVVTSGHIFAVYLKGTTPYVSYLDSMGVYQMMRDAIRNKTEMSNFFTEDQWIRLSPFIREDEFNDPNFFIIDGDSEEQKMQIMKELVEAATKELNTLCQPSLEFSMTMANILALPEFEPLFNQFQLGNFVRVHIRDDYMKRARLLEVNINFDDLSDFSCTFGNLVTTKSEIDKHADLLAQAMSAGKQVAKAASIWQRAADTSNKLEEEVQNGLQNATLQIGRASGQAITWGADGFYCRKFVDGTTDQYENEQIAIINNQICFTRDGWQTSSAVLGEFEVDANGDGVAEKLYGLIAQAMISGYIKGSTIEGGTLKIGDGSKNYFYVAEDGSVEIIQGGQSKYATTESLGALSEGRRFSTELVYTGSTIFSEPNSTCTITCKVYDWDKEITQDVLNIGGTFSWIRNSSGTSDIAWNTSHANKTANSITIKNEDVARNAHFECEVNFDPDKLKKEGEM